MPNITCLTQLAFKTFFQQQLTLSEWENLTIARVFAQNRSSLYLLSTQGELHLAINKTLPKLVVGDWILLDQNNKFQRLLQRQTLFSRRAAGNQSEIQLIAANIDSVFIVSSMNQNFNLNRIERYLVAANSAEVEAVIVLTKLDLCQTANSYIDKIKSIDPMLTCISINSLNPSSVKQLEPWCQSGNTVALLGSSGVGKSTITNTLCANQSQSTNAIRAKDQKGRHTTTNRTIHFTSAGGLIIDTPGMREFQIAESQDSLNDAFADISALAKQCKFSDCKHDSEPDCVVKEKINAGLLDERRLLNYRKLLRENARNTETLAEQRARYRAFGRYTRKIKQQIKKDKY